MEQIRNRDRQTRCASCKAEATRLILVNDKIFNSTCERHAKLNISRAAAAEAAA